MSDSAKNKEIVSTGQPVTAIVPRDIDQVQRVAEIIASAGMAPKSYGGDPSKIMVGIMHGMEVGLTPMAALQSIAVINGMPSIWGDGALAVAMASGLMIDKKEWFEGDGDKMVAHCMVHRKGREPVVRSFGVEDARSANLLSKEGPWKTYRQRMLQMRARSWALRDEFADVLRGMVIVEEVQDYERLSGPKEASIKGSDIIEQASFTEVVDGAPDDTGKVEPQVEDKTPQTESLSGDAGSENPNPASNEVSVDEVAQKVQDALNAATCAEDLENINEKYADDIEMIRDKSEKLYNLLDGLFFSLQEKFGTSGDERS